MQVPDVDVSKWVVLYPVYINVRKTIQEGRKLPKIYCIDNPTCVEMQQVCLTLGLESYIETEKCYSRDPTLRGRIRVHLKDSKTNEVVNPEITSRTILLQKFGQGINKIRTSVPPPTTTTTATAATTTTATDGPSRRKKGKGRK
eukprot:TRINITY_DN10749_c0_g1_i1.p1 TRINITY_DN10749_c0_g1~~TRINITY_DN10749_c0_g1_i1.p1  ORF type:complete len:144 (-),score=26.22 TRINITY_DN10749_c0_g1_i1:1-432(-)